MFMNFICFGFYIIILSSHIINGLLTGSARAILRNTGPSSFSTALASSGCTKTAVLYFSVWPSHQVNEPLLLPCLQTIQVSDRDSRTVSGRTRHVTSPIWTRIDWLTSPKSVLFVFSFAEVEMDKQFI